MKRRRFLGALGAAVAGVWAEMKILDVLRRTIPAPKMITVPVLRDYDTQKPIGELRILEGELRPDAILALGCHIDEAEVRGDEVHIVRFTPVSVGLIDERKLVPAGTRLDDPRLAGQAPFWREQFNLPPELAPRPIAQS